MAGTPLYNGNWPSIIESIQYEANVFKKHNVVSDLLSKLKETNFVNYLTKGRSADRKYA